MKIHATFLNLPPKSRKPARDAFARSMAAMDFLDSKLGSLYLEGRLTRKSKKFLTAIRSPSALGSGFPLSSLAVREATAQAAIEVMLLTAGRNRDLREGQKRLRLLTIKSNVGLVDIANPYFPAEQVKLHARRLLSSHELEAFCVLDHNLFSPGRGEAETIVHTHVHAVISLLEPSRSHGEWLEALTPKSEPLNLLGDGVINISSRGNRDRPKLSRADVAGLGWYVTKETCGANTVYQRRNGQKSESSFSDWSYAGVLRQLELWSYIDFRQACWSQGETMGKARTDYRRRTFELLDYYDLPKRSVIDTDRLYDGWTRVWSEFANGFIPIDPSTITASSPKSVTPPPWRPVAMSVLARPKTP